MNPADSSSIDRRRRLFAEIEAEMAVAEMIDAIRHAAHRRVLEIPVPLWLAKAAIVWLPLVERVMQIPSSAVDYFVHPGFYTCDNTLPRNPARWSRPPSPCG